MEITAKEYACSRCGTVTVQNTNHTSETYNWGRVNSCPNCPPYAKYSEYGGYTRWLCVQSMSNEDKVRLFGTAK